MLVQHDLERGRVVSERLERTPDAGDVPDVVDPPDVDQMVEPARVLVQVVGNVGGEIRRPPVAAHDHAVLVVAESRRPEPERAVLLVDQVPGPQRVEAPADRAAVVQTPLAEPRVEPDAELFEALANLLDHHADGQFLDPRQARRTGVGQAGTLGLEDPLRDLRDVRPLVAVRGDLERAAQQLEIPCLDRPREQLDLGAVVVHVEFAGDPKAERLQQTGDRLADRPVATGADVEGPGGVGADVLHEDPAAAAHVGAAVRRVLGVDAPEPPVDDRGRHKQVNEAGAGQFRARERRGRHAQVAEDDGGDVSRRPADLFRQHQRHVRRVVAVPGVAGRRDLKRRHRIGDRRQVARGDRTVHRRPHELAQLLGDHRAGRRARVAPRPPPGAVLQPDDTDPGRVLNVDGIDEANLARRRGHHQGVRADAAAEQPDAAEQVAVGDPGRGEDDVGAAHQLLGPEDPVGIADAHALGALPLVLVPIPQAPLHLTAETAQRGRGEHALGRPPDAHHRVHAGAGDGDRDRGRGVAVRDQLDPRPGAAHRRDQIGVPGPVENARP